MREHVAAAPCLAHDGPAIRGRLQHVYDFRECHAALGPFEPSRDAFTRNRAGDEHDPPIVTCEHPATGRSLLDVERENRHRYRTGSSVEGDHRQTKVLSHQTIDGGAVRLLECRARQTILEWRQLLVRLAAELRERPRIALSPRATASSSPSIALNRSTNSRRGSPRSPLASARRASSSRIAASRAASSDRSAPARSVVRRAMTRSRCAGSDSCRRPGSSSDPSESVPAAGARRRRW